MLLATVLECEDVKANEELVLNTVSAITNLSFYQQPVRFSDFEFIMPAWQICMSWPC